MAQVYEYTIVQNLTDSTFFEDLATHDADGWEVIGYNSLVFGSGGVLRTALLRRRV